MEVGELPQVAAVGIHNRDTPAAAPPVAEGDMLAVGAEGRLAGLVQHPLDV